MNDIYWQYFEEKHLVLENSENGVSISITQDEDYNLHIEFIFNIIDKIKSKSFIDSLNSNNSELITREVVYPYKKYKIRKMIISSDNCDNCDNCIEDGAIRKIKYIGQIAELYEYSPMIDDRKPDFVIYWFLNASSNLGYTECLKSYENGKSTLQWGSFDKDEFDTPCSHSTDWNCITLRYEEYKFLFGQIHDKKYEKRSFIRFERNVFPTENITFDIVALLSYIVGIELIYIGFTKFDDKSCAIEKYTYSTFRSDIKEVLRNQEIPPFPIRLDDSIGLELDPCEQINTFIEKYLKSQDKYNWKNIFWYITYARTQHPFVKMQPLATAFDIICSQYLKIENKDTVVSKENFIDIANKIEEIITNKSELNSDEKKEFINKISNFNNRSQNKKNSFIFDSLNMVVSEDEKKALNARNTAIHGNNGNTDIIQTMINNNLYMTLVNRLILKLLGLKYYIDYSQQGLVAEVEHCQSGKYSPKTL